MKNLKFIILIIITIFINSCDEEEIVNQGYTTYNLKFLEKLENKNSKEKHKIIETIEVKIDILTDEVLFDDEKLTLLENVKNKETGEISFGLVLKSENLEKSYRTDKRVPEIETRRGFFFYDGCFIAGAFYYYAGTDIWFLFVPASPTAQVISNDCGPWA
ncbi:MAG: hypothetical protein GKR88_07555 [Flavobacteriaceae bacterium]|nr:MAG: hypothetical protein GKR88_07555 [Flavobacteriaceae bacterium]